MNAFELLYFAQTALLLLGSALLLYPVVAYARNVAYTEGVVALSLSLFLLTGSYVLGGAGAPLWTRSGLSLLSAVVATVGVWYFARSFVDTGGDGPGTDDGQDTTGGFDSAGDD